MNQQYLNLALKRHEAALAELERLLGSSDINVTIGREVILNALQDIPQLVLQIEKLNEESRERGLQELVDRPWERGAQEVLVPASGGRVVVTTIIETRSP